MGAAPRRLAALDPRTLMGLLLCMSATSFVPRPLELEVIIVAAMASVQLLCGRVKMAVGFSIAFGILVWLLDRAFSGGAFLFLGTFVYSLNLARSLYAAIMVGSLLMAECSAHRIEAGLRRLRLPDAVLVSLSTTLRYFPTLAREASHIRDALRLRDIPFASRFEAFAVPLMAQATLTADELSRAAVCRGIENPAPVTDTERLRMAPIDWACLACGIALAVAVLAKGIW